MAIVTFVPADFKAAYPEFASVPDARTGVMFTIAAQSQLDNTDCSPVMDVSYRTQLFFMLVAHLLALFGAAPTSPNNRPPGRISSATEGSVTSAFEYNIPVGSSMAAWYMQTAYGAMYWTVTAPFRSMQYYAIGDSGVGYSRNFLSPPLPLPGCGCSPSPTPPHVFPSGSIMLDNGGLSLDGLQLSLISAPIGSFGPDGGSVALDSSYLALA